MFVSSSIASQFVQGALDRCVGCANVVHLAGVHSYPHFTDTDELVFRTSGWRSLLSENPLSALVFGQGPPTFANSFCLYIFRRRDLGGLILVHARPNEPSPLHGNLFLDTNALPSPSPKSPPFTCVTVVPNSQFIVMQQPGSMFERLLLPSSPKFQAEKRELAALIGPVLERSDPALYKTALAFATAPALFGYSLFELRDLRQSVDIVLLNAQVETPAFVAEAMLIDDAEDH